MNIVTISILFIVAIVLLGLYFWYYNLIDKRNTVLEALSDIDVQLRKRLDLIPNMLALAKRYMQHEMSIMTEITELRTKATQTLNPKDPNEVAEYFTNADKLTDKLGQFMLSVENYPDLKSNQTMMTAMDSFNETESQIAASRRFYNAAVKVLNNSVQIFPGNLIAAAVGIKAMPFYQTDSSVQAPIDADKIINN